MRNPTPKKRIILPDPKFNDTLVTKFVNNLMYDGKKGTSYEIFYDSIDIIEKRVADQNPLDVFKKALENVTPAVEVRSRRVGGATFQIPQEIRPARRLALGMKWLIVATRKRNDKSMAQKLANEVVAAFNNEGGAYKKKEDTHRMAEANKAFSHFRF
jgi:small subunit ribosomal protein S7